MTWKSHWQPKDTKSAWADDLNELLQDLGCDQLTKPEQLTRSDLISLTLSLRDLKKQLDACQAGDATEETP